MNQPGVGIIGCGNISSAYLSLAPLFASLEVRGIADINVAAATAQSEAFGVPAMSVEELLAADNIDVVVNLTIPDSHYDVTRQILEAGKHAYSEKPLVLTLGQGEHLMELAKKGNLRVGSAPDTFLGGTHQLARSLIDQGRIGKVIAGTAHVMSHGMEHWHPNPDFFFQPGAGPMLDLGPYYVTNLVQLIGPVKRVASLISTPSPTRTISSEPRAGETIPVNTPTNIHALLEFEQGATITLSTSWDVWSHQHSNMELYGSEGSLFVPDPNFFGGDLKFGDMQGEITTIDAWDHPFGVPNQEHEKHGMLANYRASGLADMVDAISADRPHRCSLELAIHVVDVMTSILASGEYGEFIALSTSCERPEALGPEAAQALLRS